MIKGSGIAQLMSICALPLFTRLYTSSLLGDYFLYVAIATLLSVGLSLQSHLTIVLAKTKDEAQENCFFALVINAITHSGLYFLLFLIGWLLPFIKPELEIPKLVYLYPLGSFLLSLQLIFEGYLNYNSSYKVMSKGRILRVSLMLVIQILTVWLFGPTINTLILGHLAGVLSVLVYIYICTNPFPDSKPYSGIAKFKNTYKDILVYNTGISLINSASNQLPLLIIKILFGAEAVGYYGMALRIFSTPLNLVGQNIGIVFYKKCAERLNKGNNLRVLLKSTIVTLVKFGVIPLVLLMLFSKPILVLVLGSEWGISGQLIQYLSPWLFLMYISSSVSYLITVLKLQKLMLVYEGFLLIFRITVLMLGYYVFNSFHISVGGISSVGFIFNVFFVYLLWSFVKKYDRGLKSNLYE
ncbi:lipopolysaccharide biosynthesis protein [Carboxylicivirga marina]|uniref:Oligosaccharide flippase family protein n=1 Tax=Carboxylicivirga marina TaxID=2800988 RepID=A0ABS1HMA5_9BACT|nr:oligosaccharide flippase family protein [Carboxylicivirga marina]MBK3518677.1 oligosaccharide flippase family protein [Carboxylicivirga marina]